MALTDEQRQEIKELYEDLNPTPETTIECVKDVADQVGKSNNVVRMCLQQQGAYIKKAAVAASSSTGEDKPKKASKAESQAALSTIISANGLEPNMDIIEKTTGKAAVYFTEVIEALTKEAE